MVFAFLSLLCLHIVLCIYFVVTPPRFPLHKTPLGKLYTSLFLPGPFFSEERIRTSVAFHVRYNKNGAWSPYSNPAQDWMNDYFARPWTYNNIKREHYLNTLLREMYRAVPRDSARQFEVISRTPDFCRIAAFLQHEVIRDSNVDSLQWLYVSTSYIQGQREQKYDTLWNFTFHPATVCRP